jgi:inhibitor of KinA
LEVKPIYRVISPLLGEIHWNEKPSDSLLSRQFGWMDLIQQEWMDQFQDLRQGFTSVSILWKNQSAHSRFIREFENIQIIPKSLSAKIWKVPVCYGQGFGNDLEDLARSKNLTPNELFELHASVQYRIHFFGFLPGFMYLNGLPEILHSPRKAIPERAVPAGSVAIGGSQTGIYPSQSPGGWHIIGRTPLVLFETDRNPPVWANPGESLKFVPILESEMERMLKNPTSPIFE